MTGPLRMFFVLSVVCSTAGTLWAAAPDGILQHNDLRIDGIVRSYRVYCPANGRAGGLPLMIVLHGGLGNAREIEKNTGMDAIADSGPFVVVYPNGSEGRFGLKDRRTWNASTCCGMAVRRNSDDVRFIERIISEVSETYGIDTRRVYVVGLSNGGMMAYRLASAIPDKIAAVVAVAASLTVDDFDMAKDVAVLHIHGTDDRFVPIAGGKGKNSVSGVAFRSLDDTIRIITRARRCGAPKVSFPYEGVRSSRYSGSLGAPVEVVTIQGGKHGWPGGHGRRAWLGTQGNLSASSYAWEFVKGFRLTAK